MTLREGQYDGGAASGEVTLQEGTWKLSTAITMQQALTTANFGKVVTKVMVRDAAGATVSSASLRAAAAPEERKEER